MTLPAPADVWAFALTHLDESEWSGLDLQDGLLLGLAGVIARENHADPVVDAALPVLLAFDDVAGPWSCARRPRAPASQRLSGRTWTRPISPHSSGPQNQLFGGLPGARRLGGAGREPGDVDRRLAGHLAVLVLAGVGLGHGR